MDADPRAKRAENEFYQNPDDQMHYRDMDETVQVLDEHSHLLQNQNCNPRGENFMKWIPEGTTLPSYYAITSQLNKLKTGKAIPDTRPEVPPNHKQRLFEDIIHDYVDKWSRAQYENGPWPKALRMFLMGAPGTGKSTCTKATMGALKDILGDNWTDIVKQATPTGCASFQMSSDATTVHRLFGLCLAPQRDVEPNELVKLLEKFQHGNSKDSCLCLLVIDEFGMVSRGLMGIIFERLRVAQLNLDHIGIILIGDPAQLQPIGGAPSWSIKSKTKDGKDFRQNSYFGLQAFRDIFGLPRLHKLPKYNTYVHYERVRKTTEDQRREIAEFTLEAMQGEYDAVYLTDVKRTIDGNTECDQFVTS